MIQPHTLHTIKAVPAVEIIGQFVPLRKRGTTYVALCPFHEERTPSFTVNPTKNRYKCFGCGATGDSLTFLMQLQGKTFVEAVEWIAGLSGQGVGKTPWTKKTPTPITKNQLPLTALDAIPLHLLDTTAADATSNSLTAQLATLVGEEVVQATMQDYHISLQLDGFIHFPQLDRQGRYRTGKSIQYQGGHRTGHFRWSHNELKKKGLLPDTFTLTQCLTGEHLIGAKPVAIVEGQSTMLFMAALAKAAEWYQIAPLHYFSTFTWLSTGGLTGIGWKNLQAIQALVGQNVILFPDAGFFEPWAADASWMREHGINVQVSPLLEDKYNQGQVRRNEDLRDWLMRFAGDIRQHCPSNSLHLHFSDLEPYGSQLYTGRDFDHLIIAGFHTQSGQVYDVLFHPSTEILKPGEEAATVQQLSAYFNKRFVPGLLENQPALIHTHP